MDMLVAGAVLLAVVIWLLTRKRPAPRQHASPVSTPDIKASAGFVGADVPHSWRVPVDIDPMPVPIQVVEALGGPAPTLDDAARASLMERLSHIPRPSKALHQLTSPAFLQKASSLELSELVLGEPEVAARVLATVNAPLYGLQNPVTHIGQGITFLGLNSVRAICMRHLLAQSFPVAEDLRPAFERLWTSSAIGSELCATLGAVLGLPNTGVMVTQVVLSHLGPMATLSLMPLDAARSISSKSFLERCRTERTHLGMRGADVGHLILKAWSLPESVIEGVERMDRMLDTPTSRIDAEVVSSAFSHWCTRMGERVACGDVTDWVSHDWRADDHPEVALARQILEASLGDAMTEAMRQPKVVTRLQSLMAPQNPQHAAAG